MTASWAVDHEAGEPSAMVGHDLGEPVRRRAVVMSLSTPVLALGSSQAKDDVDHAAATAAGVEVVRRRSGGGAVLLRPGAMVWIDVVIPADDPRWVDDVGRSFHWIGEVWRAALAVAGVAAEVHRGPLERTEWSRRVCFAGLGPGELTVDGRKVVGLSQRRTRAGARFQCLVLADWDPVALLDLLALTPDERARGGEALAASAAGVGGARLARVEAAFLSAVQEAA